MKPRHVLILAATLFLGTALYAAFSTPEGGSGVLAFLAPLAAAITSAWFAVRASSTRNPDQRPSRAAPLAHAILAVALIGVAVFAVATRPRPVNGQPAPGESVVAKDESPGAPVNGFTITKTPHVAADTTHIFFAAAFSAGVSLLAALTLAFQRGSDIDESDEAPTLPA